MAPHAVREIKSVEHVLPVHMAQLLTKLRPRVTRK
jgi:hypothetical protein